MMGENYAVKVVQNYFDEVCRRAEKIMEKTGKVEGAHYAAMQQVLKEYRDTAKESGGGAG